MELLVAILIFLGYLTSPDAYTETYRLEKESEVSRAQYIIDNNYYRTDDGGGIISIEETDWAK